MAYIDLVSMLGYSNNATMMMETFRGSSNVIITDNPEYTCCDFKNVFPLFVIGESVDEIPVEVFNLFKAMADKAIKYDRYKTSWKYCMGLYIAHNLTLYLKASQGDPGTQAVLASSLPVGIASSKSVDGLSISYDFMGAAEDYAGYGTWKLTTYGQQLITMTKMYRGAGMWVNG